MRFARAALPASLLALAAVCSGDDSGTDPEALTGDPVTITIAGPASMTGVRSSSCPNLPAPNNTACVRCDNVIRTATVSGGRAGSGALWEDGSTTTFTNLRTGAVIGVTPIPRSQIVADWNRPGVVTGQSYTSDHQDFSVAGSDGYRVAQSIRYATGASHEIRTATYALECR